MGDKGYSILIWDSFGSGLVRINPRLYEEGVDIYGNPCNWWPRPEGFNDADIIKKHDLNNNSSIKKFKIIKD